MDSQIRISDLENVISEKIFIKIEKWNLYLGDAGLARHLAIECISNKAVSYTHLTLPTNSGV